MNRTINGIEYISCFTNGTYEVIKLNGNKGKIIFRLDTIIKLIDIMENLEKFI